MKSFHCLQRSCFLKNVTNKLIDKPFIESLEIYDSVNSIPFQTCMMELEFKYLSILAFY